MKVLVTRPVEQAESLCERIGQVGHEAIKFPVIKICPIPPTAWAKIDVTDLDLLIFVSRNAVIHFVAAWQGVLPKGVQLIAVGGGTAAEMQAAGLSVDAQALIENSEGLLALLSTVDMENKRICIVRGAGGREALAAGLRARGARVEYVEVYQRQLPKVLPAQQMLAVQANCVIVTSVAALDNMLLLLARQKQKIQQQALIVISERIARHAVQYGFKQVIVASGASDDAIMQALLGMKIEE